MSAPLSARLLIDPPLPGDWNMAVDESLLELASESAPCLRFYRWSEPTLSLGYFQRHSDRSLHPASSDCPLVRRASGGGAIVHDLELTYSFVAPLRERFSSHAEQLYQDFHSTLLGALAEFGVIARLCEAGPRDLPGARSLPFLCFERRTAGDVLCGDHKIAGSAQRRRRGAVLQHGSVLLRQSRCAPELPGVFEMTGRDISAQDLVACWSDQLARGLPLRLEPSTLSSAEHARACELVGCQFANPQWTNRR